MLWVGANVKTDRFAVARHRLQELDDEAVTIVLVRAVDAKAWKTIGGGGGLEHGVGPGCDAAHESEPRCRGIPGAVAGDSLKRRKASRVRPSRCVARARPRTASRPISMRSMRRATCIAPCSAARWESPLR